MSKGAGGRSWSKYSPDFKRTHQYVQITAINQLWVADITYLRLGREFVYLAVVLDVSHDA